MRAITVPRRRARRTGLPRILAAVADTPSSPAQAQDAREQEAMERLDGARVLLAAARADLDAYEHAVTHGLLGALLEQHQKGTR